MFFVVVYDDAGYVRGNQYDRYPQVLVPGRNYLVVSAANNVIFTIPT